MHGLVVVASRHLPCFETLTTAPLVPAGTAPFEPKRAQYDIRL